MTNALSKVLSEAGVLDDAVTQRVVETVMQENIFFHHTSRSAQHTGCLSSSKLRETFFRKSDTFVEPNEIILGNRNGKTRTYMYVPLLVMLRTLLAKQEILQCFIRCSHRTESNCYKSFTDGTACKSHDLFSKEETPIMIGLYYDDFKRPIIHLVRRGNSTKCVHSTGFLLT